MFRALAGLDDIDWSALSHAYGEASDTPHLLRALQDPEDAENALSDLYGSILHQGTLYPAKPPALPFLAALARDTATPDRPALLGFLAHVGEAIDMGYGHPDPRGLRGHYLPKGTDIDAFEARIRAAFATACEAIAPCLDDVDPAVRAAVPPVWSQLSTLPEGLIDGLHRRLAIEADAPAIGAIAATLRQKGGLTEAERGALAVAPASTRFSVARAALRSDQPLDARDIATLQACWADCAAAFAEDIGCRQLMEELIQARTSAILPLLDDLAARPDVSSRADAAAGYLALAHASRAGTDAAVEGLLRVATSFTVGRVAGAADDTIPDRDEMYARRHLVIDLRDVATLDGGDRDRRIAEALYALALTDPAPAWEDPRLLALARAGSARPKNGFEADAAAALARLGDQRWMILAAWALDALAPGSELWARYRNGSRSFLGTWTTGTNDEGALLRLVGRELVRDPSQAQYLLALLITLPEARTRELLPDVVAHLGTATRPACDLLARWKAQVTVAPLRKAIREAGGDRCWCHAALAAITGEASELDRGWAARPDPFYFEGEYLARWREMPTGTLYAACRSKLTGEAMPSWPGRDVQLIAARVMLPIDGAAAVWPTIRAIIAKGGKPLHEAIVIAVEALQQAPDRSMRAELAHLLEHMRVNGRHDHFGKDLDAPVEAALGLLAIEAGAPGALAATAMEALRTASRAPLRASTLQRASTLLVALAGRDAAVRVETRACLQDLLDADRRIEVGSLDGVIAADETFRDTVRRAIAAL